MVSNRGRPGLAGLGGGAEKSVGIALLGRAVDAFEVLLNQQAQGLLAGGKVEVQADLVVGGPVANVGSRGRDADGVLRKGGGGRPGIRRFQPIQETASAGKRHLLLDGATGG